MKRQLIDRKRQLIDRNFLEISLTNLLIILLRKGFELRLMVQNILYILSSVFAGSGGFWGYK